MTPNDLRQTMDDLLALPCETEWVEFKRAENSMGFDDIGKYFSALSNEANLKAQSWGWLVLGVDDGHPRRVRGTNYRLAQAELEHLKAQVANHTTGRLTFQEVHALRHAGERVVLMQIPPAPTGMPVAWKGHFYGRDGESLVALNILEIEQIRAQATKADWSAQVIEGASLGDLAPEAVAKAREEFLKKFPDKADELRGWDDTTFLNKAKVLRAGRVTNTAILLLGLEEAHHLLEPAIGQMTWVLRDAGGTAQDYQHFGPPFLLNTAALFGRVRNLRYRYTPDSSLFPTEVMKYEPWVIREALHNCIAHQDYSLARIFHTPRG